MGSISLKKYGLLLYSVVRYTTAKKTNKSCFTQYTTNICKFNETLSGCLPFDLCINFCSVSICVHNFICYNKMKIGIENKWLFLKLTLHGIFYFYFVLSIYLLQIPSCSAQRGSFYASVNPAAKYLSACQRKALKPVKEGKWNKKVYWHLSQSASS